MPKKITRASTSKAVTPKETKAAAKKTSRRKKDSDESEEEFTLDDISDNDSDRQEELDIKKKLSKLDEESDFEPLEPWEDDKPAKNKTKKVKKTSSGKSTAQNSTTKSVTSSRGSTAKKSATSTDTKPKKGAAKGNKISDALKQKVQGDEGENDDGNFFHNDEHPQFDESSAYIPNFLVEPHLRDKEGRYSNEEGYDPTTLFVPPDDLQNFRPLLRQYWDVKSKHFDKLVGIKVWKFYYFYFHDALIVHRIIDMRLTMMGSSTYCFFHESCLARFAPKLLAAGYKIVIVEQMEEMKRDEQGVVRREICQILTRGTAIENQELDYSSRFMLALFEDNLNFGVAFIDTTTHEFYIGEFKDDKYRSNLRTLLIRTKPVEVVHMRDYIEQDTLNMLRSLSPKPTLSTIKFNEPKHFADVFETLNNYFTPKDKDKPVYPELLQTIKDSIENTMKGGEQLDGTRLSEFERKIPFYFTIQCLAISAEFLKSVLLVETVFAMGHFTPFDISLEKRGTLYLDSQALENLEVLDVQYLNVLSESSSLFGYMDKTVSAFGKRMLKRWLTSPLLDTEAIRERQEAIGDLLKNEDAVKFIQEGLTKFPDLERMINRVYNMGNRQRLSAIYFEDYAKNRLKEFLAFLKELKKVEEFMESLDPYLPGFRSRRVIQLTHFKDVDIQAFKQRKKVVGKKGKKAPKADEEEEERPQGLFPRVKDIITDLEEMVELREGLPIPAPGVSKDTDEVIAKIDEIKGRLNGVLEQTRKRFNCQDIKYVHTRHRYELEVPEKLVEGSKRPKEFAITSKRIGFLRFHTPEIEESLKKLWGVETEFQKVLVPFLVDYFKKFYERNNFWQQIINCLGELDCLCSLARLANSMDLKCRPEILPFDDKTTFELKGMVHPMAARNNPKFVPNDIMVKKNTNIFLITGPNMGGKSTLLRQACLAVIMAQVGSFVPATSFKFSLVDRIFTRIGASDRIFEGKSTFFVELEETYNIVREATKHSLLIVDELGRGTSTYDGVSIAYATLKYIAEKIGSMTLFATHYHLLLEEFKLYKNIDTYFMDCEFNEKKDEIKFLYKFVKGQALKSHGIIIGKVAGLPDHVTALAKEKAAFMTSEKRNIGFEKNLMEKFNKIIDEVAKVKGKGVKDYDAILTELDQLH